MLMTNNGATPVQVLLVEDNPGDVRLTLEAFTDARVHLQMNVVRDGIEAMDFLKQRGAHNQSPRPDLILAGPEPLPRRMGGRCWRRSRGMMRSRRFR